MTRTRHILRFMWKLLEPVIGVLLLPLVIVLWIFIGAVLLLIDTWEDAGRQP